MRSLHLLVLSLVLVACEAKKQPPKPQLQAQAEVEKPSASASEAKELFNTRCAVCHGPQGKGDGAAAAALNPKPRDMSNAEWQKSVNDDHLKKVIVEGGASVGKSPLMAPNPDLKERPEVLSELVKHVRSLQR